MNLSDQQKDRVLQFVKSKADLVNVKVDELAEFVIDVLNSTEIAAELDPTSSESFENKVKEELSEFFGDKTEQIVTELFEIVKNQQSDVEEDKNSLEISDYDNEDDDCYKNYFARKISESVNNSDNESIDSNQDVNWKNKARKSPERQDQKDQDKKGKPTEDQTKERNNKDSKSSKKISSKLKPAQPMMGMPMMMPGMGVPMGPNPMGGGMPPGKLPGMLGNVQGPLDYMYMKMGMWNQFLSQQNQGQNGEGGGFVPPMPPAVNPFNKTNQQNDLQKQKQQAQEKKERKVEKNVLYIKNLPNYYNNAENLTKYFKRFGAISGVTTDQTSKKAEIKYFQKGYALKAINCEVPPYDNKNILLSLTAFADDDNTQTGGEKNGTNNAVKQDVKSFEPQVGKKPQLNPINQQQPAKPAMQNKPIGAPSSIKPYQQPFQQPRNSENQQPNQQNQTQQPQTQQQQQLSEKEQEKQKEIQKLKEVKEQKKKLFDLKRTISQKVTSQVKHLLYLKNKQKEEKQKQDVLN